MNENLDRDQSAENAETEQSEIIINEYGATLDQAVVVDEETRTVLLTNDETIIIEKAPTIGIAPKDRPPKIYAGMWGRAEAATVGAALLAILTVILLFVFLVLPAEKELEQNRAERDRLEKELVTARSRYGTITSTEEQVARLITSVTDFETRFLPIAANGRTALYQRINGLIGAYGLVNTSGPDYAPLEIADQRSGQQQQSEDDNGRAKFQSIFPGVYITMTIEGSYQNLRRFIREVETSEQFVVISAVELEPSDNSEKQNQPANPPQTINSVTITQPNQTNPINPTNPVNQINPANPNPQPNPNSFGPAQPKLNAARGKTHGETVSLRLEMAAYFRRLNIAPAETETITQ